MHACGARDHSRARRAPNARRIFSLGGLRYAGLLAILTALGGGAAFAAVEGRAVDTWDNVWWAVTTMTTVGYGDLTPATGLGRIVAMFVMLVGIGFLTLVIGAVSQRFLAGDVTPATRRTETRRKKAMEGFAHGLRVSSVPTVHPPGSVGLLTPYVASPTMRPSPRNEEEGTMARLFRFAIVRRIASALTTAGIARDRIEDALAAELHAAMQAAPRR